MADVKWIKLNVGMFDGNSFKKIKKAKIGGESFRDKLTAVWFELLDFAGKCNANGQLIESPEIPFSSIEDIAILIDREPEELQLCMQYFINNRMITVIDDVYMLTNWMKYQNTDGLDKIKAQNRKRQAKFKQKQKNLLGNVTDNVTDNVTVTQSNATEVERELELELDLEKEVEVVCGETPPDDYTDNDSKLEYFKGKVMLSENQVTDLLEKMGLDAFNEYVDRLDRFLSRTDATIKSHYSEMLKWYTQDNVNC